MNLDALLQLGALGVLAYTLHRTGLPLVAQVRALTARTEALTLALVQHLGLPADQAQRLLRTGQEAPADAPAATKDAAA